jgi:hypothetical protein
MEGNIDIIKKIINIAMLLFISNLFLILKKIEVKKNTNNIKGVNADQI